MGGSGKAVADMKFRNGPESSGCQQTVSRVDKSIGNKQIAASRFDGRCMEVNFDSNGMLIAKV